MKNYSLIIFIIFFSLLLTLSKCQYASFILDIDPNQNRCLNEYYKIQTVVIVEITSESKDILTDIKAPNGRIVYHNINSTSIYSFTTQHNGFMNYCMQNMGRDIAEVKIVIKSGVGANDYSSVAKSKDLEPIDYELDKILKKETMLNHFNQLSQERKESFGTLYKSISSKIIFYSILMIIGMILIGVVETLYLKRFMEKRKII